MNNFNFGRNVVVPFVSGILGAGIVVGTCFGVPDIKNNLLKFSSNSNSTEKEVIENSNNNTSSVNTSHVSLTNYSDTSVAVAKKVLPSVVSIKVEYSVSSVFLREVGSASALGSGVIISEDGYILTNNHIVNSTSGSSYYELSKANKVTVSLYNDNTEYEATIVGTDDITDLAVIKINKTGLAVAELGDSDSVQVGEFVMSIGSPLHMENSIFSGIISGVNREITTEGRTYHLIQTDAAINSGISGGALVNSKGQVIGITTMKMAATGIEGMGFAIPINSTKDIYQQLIQYNKVKRPYIGISGRELDNKLAEANNLVVGIYVLTVDEFSAAEKSGIKIGDVITSIDGKKVKNMDELNEIKNTHNIGDEVKLTIFRDGSEKEITLTLQEQP